MGQFTEETKRLWIAPDGKEFDVKDDHVGWIRANKSILDTYGVIDWHRIRRKLMEIGWLRIKFGQHRFREAREFDYVEAQFNLENENAWKIAEKYLLRFPDLRLYVGNYNESLLTTEVLSTNTPLSEIRKKVRNLTKTSGQNS